MAVVVFLICVVAAFNVVGTLTMLVRDKTREIGILLAMGLRRTSIRRIFLAQGILIGLTGTLLGVLLGLVLGGMVNEVQWIHIDPSIYFIDHLPVRTQLVDVFFFQAEDGIRDLTVTGVQTCALPISHDHAASAPRGHEYFGAEDALHRANAVE